MPITPVEGVGGKIGGHDTERLHAVELILTHGLGMNHHRAVIAERRLLAGELQRIDQHLGGGVTVAVHQHGHLLADEPCDPLVDGFLRDGGIAPVVVGQSFWNYFVWLA